MFARTDLVVAIAVALLISGCGGTGSDRRASPPRLAGSNSVRLISQRVPHGYVVIIAQDYEVHGVPYVELTAAREAAGVRGIESGRPGYGVTSSGGGVALGPGSTRRLAIGVSGGCGSAASTPFVFGLLRGPTSTVAAEGPGWRRVLKTAAIPPDLHPHGAVVVYAALPPGAARVVARAPNGHVSAEEEYGAQTEACLGGS